MACCRSCFGDPLASVAMTAPRQTMTMGLIPPSVYASPDDVLSLQVLVAADFRALDQTFNSCDKLSAQEAIAYDQLSGAWWKSYKNEGGINYISSNAKYQETVGYQQKAKEWQQIFSDKGCAVVGPAIVPKQGKTAEDLASDYMGTIKTVAIAGAVIAGVVLAYPFVTELLVTKHAARAR